MAKITTLSEQIVKRTAAGEVVERPASVVKELIENSIDGNCSMIRVRIEESGIKKIQVIDDGEGMSPEDLQLCLLPHTTSKITLLEDLGSIKTLGFRGEALASIGAVSNLHIKSKIENSALGYEIESKLGELSKIREVGMLKGTEVTVADLFNSTPARKKFLRSLRTEYQHILDVILEHALAFPNIGFTFFSDGKLIVDLPKNQTFEERVEAVFGAQNFSNLFTFIKESNHIEISGFLSKPQLSTRVRNNQYIIVNNRSVRNELISGVIKKTYGSLLDHESFPVFILRVNVPFEMVDVNVHPRKEEVAFWDDEKLSTLLSKAVSEAINTHDLTYTSSVVGETTEEYYRKPSTFVFDTLKEDVTPWDFYSEIGEDPNNILQVGKLYLVSVSKNGKNLQIIDQHAAHERILYEQFLDNLKNIKEENSTFILESPVLINLSLKDSTLLSEHLKLLENIGFHIENFGTQTYKIFSIPNILKDHNLEFLINELLDEIKINKLPSVPERKLLKTISYLSCRSAIKAGDYLTMEERRQLLEKLETTKSNYTCPHGRPVKFEMHMSGLAKMFKRIK